MPLRHFQPEQYPQLLETKVEQIRARFLPFYQGDIDVFDSPLSGFRMRAEFRLWHEGDDLYYAMFDPSAPKTPLRVDEFPIASATIQALMPALRAALAASPMLRRKLFQVEFLSTLNGECLVTLIYHRKLEPDWEDAARELQQQLGVAIIGRSRRQKLVLEQDSVIETLDVDGRQYQYQQVESSFTQPNARVCEKMLSWACAQAQAFEQNQASDLVELYCGNGNFSLPLARHFRRVLATEISKTSVRSARYNAELNGVDNLTVVRMSSEEFSEAMTGAREFRRLEGLDIENYDLNTVFVDPPRAGLDPDTIELVRRFDNVLYISCNPETLVANAEALGSTHTLQRLALFDQFPYTDHIECGAVFQRR